ncbi:MAG: nucleotidyl transferase AbiEii/AbiGii toxin family protein [Sphingobacteriales bacterium]|nr:nucleotidyl transferase AbiEii/AbiGii toxin family protein [Sphingobacteriales bacterium]MBI3717763.1 nucleotidyl transferase AbiEii/AbiGii toxin family protein [Sphingobacteriales bacterium]
MLYKNAVEPTALEILTIISSQQVFDTFALGGGTGIAIRKGHRFSVDLDFFTNQPFDTQAIYKNIISLFTGSELLFEQKQTMMFTVNGIKVDFVLYPFEWLKPFEEEDGLKLISIEDIIPMKLQAVSNRFSKKDFWDIEELLNAFSLEEMITIFKQKFPPIDTGHIIHSLTEFDSADEEDDPVCIVPKSWETVKDNLTKAVKNYTEDFL